MWIQKGNAQQSSSMQSDEIGQLQMEMMRLTAHIVKLTAQQQSPALRNLRLPGTAISASPEHWQLPIRGTSSDVLLPLMLHT
uniref:Uncharacterized protein n=1 Tax=Romanomermis culicivorax TaxID=13658 RepID=A0A915KKG0_ROMCU